MTDPKRYVAFDSLRRKANARLAAYTGSKSQMLDTLAQSLYRRTRGRMRIVVANGGNLIGMKRVEGPKRDRLC